MENDKIIMLSREYNFEGKKYTELDLSGLDDLTVNDLTVAQRLMTAKNEYSVMPETSLTYCLSLAASATQLPIEFFQQLKAKDAVTIRTKVTTTFLA